MKFDIEQLIAEVNSMATREWNAPRLADLPAMPPESEDPNILFTNNFLAKGQSMALVGSSGAGKSSMTMQQCYHWAVGKTFLATPTRPLKITVIQSEDSPRDLDDQRRGMRNGLAMQGWTAEEIAEAEKSILMPTDFLGLQGDDFINLLREYQGDMKQDLIAINPLQGVFGADLSDQESASHFCRAGLDPIMKDPVHGCAIDIVMHTPKQKSGVKDGRASVDDYAEYMMAGSQEWTAWCRAIFTFLKHGKARGAFDLTCPKRGQKLDWPNPKRVFRFAPADIGIFWLEVTDPAEIQALDTVRAVGGDGYSEQEVGEAMQSLLQFLRDNPAQTRSAITRGEVPFGSYSRQVRRAAGAKLLANIASLRLTERFEGRGCRRTQYIGFAEGLRTVAKQTEQRAKIDALQGDNLSNPLADTPTKGKNTPTFAPETDENGPEPEENDMPF